MDAGTTFILCRQSARCRQSTGCCRSHRAASGPIRLPRRTLEALWVAKRSNSATALTRSWARLRGATTPRALVEAMLCIWAAIMSALRLC